MTYPTTFLPVLNEQKWIDTATTTPKQNRAKQVRAPKVQVVFGKLVDIENGTADVKVVHPTAPVVRLLDASESASLTLAEVTSVRLQASTFIVQDSVEYHTSIRGTVNGEREEVRRISKFHRFYSNALDLCLLGVFLLCGVGSLLSLAGVVSKDARYLAILAGISLMWFLLSKIGDKLLDRK